MLDRNSENLFAQIVQAAFDVANMIPGIETPAPPGRLTGQGAQGCSRHYQRGSAVTLRPGEPSGGRSAAAEVPGEVLAGQDGDADAADEEDQHPDGVQVGRDQPERADD